MRIYSNEGPHPSIIPDHGTHSIKNQLPESPNENTTLLRKTGRPQGHVHVLVVGSKLALCDGTDAVASRGNYSRDLVAELDEHEEGGLYNNQPR